MGVSFHFFFFEWTKNFLMEFFQVNCIVNGKVSSSRYLIGIFEAFQIQSISSFWHYIKFAQQSGMKKNQFSPHFHENITKPFHRYWMQKGFSCSCLSRIKTDKTFWLSFWFHGLPNTWCWRFRILGIEVEQTN